MKKKYIKLNIFFKYWGFMDRSCNFTKHSMLNMYLSSGAKGVINMVNTPASSLGYSTGKCESKPKSWAYENIMLRSPLKVLLFSRFSLFSSKETRMLLYVINRIIMNLRSIFKIDVIMFRLVPHGEHSYSVSLP